MFGTVELLRGPTAGTAVAARRHAPRELGENTDVGGGQPCCHPGGVVAVAPVLPQEISEVPDGRQRIIGHLECSDAGGEVSAIDRQDRSGTPEQLPCPLDPVGLFADQSAQLADSTVCPSDTDRVRVGAGPRQLYRWHDHCCAEHTERCGDHLAWHLPEQAAAAGEVGRPVRERHAIRVAGARVEADDRHRGFRRRPHHAAHRGRLRRAFPLALGRQGAARGLRSV